MDRHNLKFNITNLSGEVREYNLQPLKRKDAAYVAHTFLQAVLKTIAKAGNNPNKGDGQAAILEALSNIGFDLLWEVASLLLKYAVIKTGKEIVEINDLNDCEYFEENPDELYRAVYEGIMGNYPKVFSKVREALKGFVPAISDAE